LRRRRAFWRRDRTFGSRGAFALRLRLRERLLLGDVLLELLRLEDLVFLLGAETLRDLERETDLLREVDLLLRERDRLTLMLDSLAEATDGAFGAAARRLLRARRFLDRLRGAGEGDLGTEARRRRLRDFDLRGALALAERLLLVERETVLLERLLLEAETEGDLGVEALRLLLLGALVFFERPRLLADRELATLLPDEGARGVAARLLLLRARRFLDRRRGDGEAAGAFGMDDLRRPRRLGDLEALRLFLGFFTLRACEEGDGDVSIERLLFFRAFFCASW